MQFRVTIATNCRVLTCYRNVSYVVGHKRLRSQMAVRLSALRSGRPLPPGRFLVLISVRG
jgi:hypothetical protein